jgi:hypothetical protein
MLPHITVSCIPRPRQEGPSWRPAPVFRPQRYRIPSFLAESHTSHAAYSANETSLHYRLPMQLPARVFSSCIVGTPMVPVIDSIRQRYRGEAARALSEGVSFC